MIKRRFLDTVLSSDLLRMQLIRDDYEYLMADYREESSLRLERSWRRWIRSMLQRKSSQVKTVLSKLGIENLNAKLEIYLRAYVSSGATAGTGLLPRPAFY